MTSDQYGPQQTPRRRWFDLRRPLPLEDAQHRTTAYVYGNILVLAALVQVSLHEITGRSVVTVLGTSLSVFLAHVFAGVVTSTWSWRNLARQARDSVPILSSGLFPSFLLLTALLGAPSEVAIFLAELLLVARLALIGIVIARLRGVPTSSHTVLAGVGAGVVGLGIVVIKVVLTH